MAARQDAEPGTAEAADPARPDACQKRHPAAALTAAPSATILSYIDLGPKLLFSTRHNPLAGPYHRSNAGLRLTIELFRMSDDTVLRVALSEHGVDWIATCPGIEEDTANRTEDGNGLAERLAAGAVSDFLEPVGDAAQPNMEILRVRR